MKTTLLATALAGTAFAHGPGPNPLAALKHGPGHIAPRQIVDVKPEIKEGAPEACSKAIEAFTSAAPAQPTIFEEASSSFYETASRTASEAYEDCAWVTNMPDAAATAWAEWEDELVEWVKDGKNLKLFEDEEAACEEYNEDLNEGGEEALCGEEWVQFFNEAMQITGWTPNLDGLPESLGGSGDSAAPAVQAYAPAAVLAAFMGAVAVM